MINNSAFITRINILHFNDSHGSIKNVDSFLKTQDEFYKSNPKTPTFTFCAGDTFASINNETLAKKLASIVHAFCYGNHDLEGGLHTTRLIEKFNMAKKWLSCNIKLKPTPKADEMSKTISNSTIVEDKGERIGVIGVSPFDFRELAFINDECDFIEIEQLEKTKKLIEEEVKNLESKGINKIILLAHTGQKTKDGVDIYSQFAQIGGIDVILGGHDHVEVNTWAESKRGEPVKIASCGKSDTHSFEENLDYVGKMNLAFDDSGVLIPSECKNHFECIKKECKKDGEVIFQFDKPFEKGLSLFGHSEIGNFLADSTLFYVNQNTESKKADFAFVNAGSIRGNFDNSSVTLNDIKEISPFTLSTLIKAPLTKKQIINTLTWCAQSTTFQKVSPGCMQVAGMEYTINKDNSVSGVHILNEDGTIKYNLDDFDDDCEFLAVYDIFLATGVAGLIELKRNCEKDKTIEFFDVAAQGALEYYLKNAKEFYDWEQVRIKKI